MGARRRCFLIDGTMAKGGGGFTYLLHVAPALARLAPNDRFVLLVRSARLASTIERLPNLEVRLLPETGLLGRLAFSYVRARRIARECGADLYYSAGETVPAAAGIPVIASFQNPNVFASVEDPWPLAQRARLLTLRAIAWLSARIAERVVFVSHDSANWMGQAAHVASERRGVVTHGIPDGWATAAPEAPPLERPFILAVSSIYRYKNYTRLIEGYGRLARQRHDVPDLVIVGDNQDSEYFAKMEASRQRFPDLIQRIHFVGSVLHSKMASFFSHASLFVFPSYLETFGIPLIEAMEAGLPIVASDIPVFREIAQDAAAFVSPFDVDGWRDAMLQALYSPPLRAALVKRGRERAKAFRWERAAQDLMQIFEESLSRWALDSRITENATRHPEQTIAGYPTTA